MKAILYSSLFVLVGIQAHGASDIDKCITIAKSYCPGIKSLSSSNKLVFKLKNGKRVKCSDKDDYRLDKRSDYLQQVNNVDASDILKQAYPYSYDFQSPLGKTITASAMPVPIEKFNYSPGRFRNDDLLTSVYGSSTKEVKAKTRVVDFLGVPTRFTTANGAAEALERVARQIKAVGLDKYFWEHRNSTGSLVFRKISGTNRISAHSYGMTIDFTLKKNKHLKQYWKWNAVCRTDIENAACLKGRASKQPEDLLDVVVPTKKQMDMFDLPNQSWPLDIVSIFETNGFIWGGKWFHYDTMHFEYRPEFMGGNQPCDHIVKKIKKKFNLK